MSDCGYKKIQLGQTGWILGDLPNLVAGALEVHIYICPQCGKIEFFRTASSDTQNENDLAQVKCPKCGENVEVFVIMGGPIGKTGTLAGDEKCTCGHILPAGSYETDYEK